MAFRNSGPTSHPIPGPIRADSRAVLAHADGAANRALTADALIAAVIRFQLALVLMSARTSASGVRS
jgi:hypothetical protein